MCINQIFLSVERDRTAAQINLNIIENLLVHVTDFRKLIMALGMAESRTSNDLIQFGLSASLSSLLASLYKQAVLINGRDGHNHCGLYIQPAMQPHGKELPLRAPVEVPGITLTVLGWVTCPLGARV